MKAVAFPHLPLPTPDQSVFGVNHDIRALTTPQSNTLHDAFSVFPSDF